MDNSINNQNPQALPSSVLHTYTPKPALKFRKLPAAPSARVHFPLTGGLGENITVHPASSAEVSRYSHRVSSPCQFCVGSDPGYFLLKSSQLD